MSNTPREMTIVPAPADVGERLDGYLARQAGLSRARVQALIAEGHVCVGAHLVAKPAYRLRSGDAEVSLTIPAAKPLALKPEPMPLDVLFEDEHMIAINKPPGVVVHPGAGHETGTLVHALLHHCPQLSGIGGVQRPGIVHRLDRQTSGVLVAAKNDAAHRGLAEQFAERRLKKYYDALVVGSPAEPEGLIDTPFGRHPKHRQRFTGRAGPKRARTRYRLIAQDKNVAWLRLRLYTGRTHQIRVHCAEMGCPVLLDAVYSTPRARRLETAFLAGRQVSQHALHASVLRFVHPITGAALRLRAPFPPALSPLFASLQHVG